MRKTVLSLALLCATPLALSLATPAAAAECTPERVEMRGDWGSARFRVEIADDPAERAQGLMNVEAMPRGEGMLFVYEYPQRTAFWMKNTLIPLDMIFLDKTGTVTRVHDSAVPGDLTAIEGGDEVFAVLEINGGLAERYGMGPGTVMRHPVFAQGPAAWPC